MANREEIKLSPEQKKQLQDLDGDIAWVQKELARAKSIGVDVSSMEESLAGMDKTRQGLLRLY